MAEAKNRNNIRQFKKTIPINIGMIIFGIIFIYILICVFLFFTTKHIVGYEVKMGTLSVANNYRGLALREETVIESENSGYVNYYAREGERADVG